MSAKKKNLVIKKICEDKIWDQIASERKENKSKKYSHKDAWK